MSKQQKYILSGGGGAARHYPGLGCAMHVWCDVVWHLLRRRQRPFSVFESAAQCSAVCCGAIPSPGRGMGCAACASSTAMSR